MYMNEPKNADAITPARPMLAPDMSTIIAMIVNAA